MNDHHRQKRERRRIIRTVLILAAFAIAVYGFVIIKQSLFSDWIGGGINSMAPFDSFHQYTLMVA